MFIGMSALVLLIAKWAEDQALEILNKFKATIIRTSFSQEDEFKLKVALEAGK